MKANDEKYPKARYDFDTNPQVYGFKVGETYRFRDFGRGVEVFYNDGCSLAMGYNMFNECFTKIMKTNKAPEKIYVSQHSGLHSYEKNNEDDIEYTRTDAFIEKACSWLKSKCGFTIGFSGAEIKDFKNYMKGE